MKTMSQWPTARGSSGRHWGGGRSAFMAAVLVSELSAAAPVAALPTFELITSVADKGASKLVNGHVVKPDDWPALVTAVVGFELVAGEEVPIRCSGALIGPGVLLTAAHCLDTGGDHPLRTELSIDLRPKGARKLTCAASPQYRLATNVGEVPRVAQDYALCFYDASDLDPQLLPPYEIVDVASKFEAQDRIVLTGWGCRTLTYTDGRWVAKPLTGNPSLTIADAKITTVPNMAGPFEDRFLSVVSNIVDSTEEPALCKGDSGGPMIRGVTLAEPKGTRRVAGVNSWVGPYKTSNSKVRSGIAPLSDGDFQAFATGWLATWNGAAICGLKDATSAPATHCRP